MTRDNVQLDQLRGLASIRSTPETDADQRNPNCTLRPLNKTADQQAEQMRSALEEIREKAATMDNGGAWAAGLATLCLGTL